VEHVGLSVRGQPPQALGPTALTWPDTTTACHSRAIPRSTAPPESALVIKETQERPQSRGD
jgi:hypothetical protein